MAATPLLHNSAIRFLREKGIDFNMPSDRVIVSQVAVSEKMRPLGFIIIDISESVAAGDGFMIVVPNLIAFKADKYAAFAANELNSLQGEGGKFIGINRTLGFKLEIIVPENSADPEQVEAALDRAVDAVMKFYAVLIEAVKMAKEAMNTAADDGGWDLGDAWDYSGYSAPA